MMTREKYLIAQIAALREVAQNAICLKEQYEIELKELRENEKSKISMQKL